MSRRDSRENAGRIVDALCRLWTRDAAPALDEIAREAGVGVATLYRHFANRAVLEREAFRKIFADDILPVVNDTEDRTLLDVAENFVAVIARYTPLLLASGGSDIADEAIDDVAEPFAELLRAGQEAGVIRRDLEPIDLYWLLRMVVLGLAHENASSAVRRRYLAITLAGVSPEAENELPPLTADDYRRLAVPPEHRGGDAGAGGNAGAGA